MKYYRTCDHLIGNTQDIVRVPDIERDGLSNKNKIHHDGNDAPSNNHKYQALEFAQLPLLRTPQGVNDVPMFGLVVGLGSRGKGVGIFARFE